MQQNTFKQKKTLTYLNNTTNTFTDPCNEHSCSDICVPSSDGRAVCLCDFGYFLKGDMKTCHAEIVHDDFLLITDEYQHKVLQVCLL